MGGWWKWRRYCREEGRPSFSAAAGRGAPAAEQSLQKPALPAPSSCHCHPQGLPLLPTSPLTAPKGSLYARNVRKTYPLPVPSPFAATPRAHIPNRFPNQPCNDCEAGLKKGAKKSLAGVEWVDCVFSLPAHRKLLHSLPRPKTSLHTRDTASFRTTPSSSGPYSHHPRVNEEFGDRLGRERKRTSKVVKDGKKGGGVE